MWDIVFVGLIQWVEVAITPLGWVDKLSRCEVSSGGYG